MAGFCVRKIGGDAFPRAEPRRSAELFGPEFTAEGLTVEAFG
jgi:hypothetical protein